MVSILLFPFLISASSCRSAADCVAVPSHCGGWKVVSKTEVSSVVRDLSVHSSKEICRLVYADFPDISCTQNRCEPHEVVATVSQPSPKLIQWAIDLLLGQTVKKPIHDPTHLVPRALEVLRFFPSSVRIENRRVDPKNRVKTKETLRYYSVCLDIKLSSGVFESASVIPKCKRQY